MLTAAEIERARERAAEAFAVAGIALAPGERAAIEVADFGSRGWWSSASSSSST